MTAQIQFSTRRMTGEPLDPTFTSMFFPAGEAHVKAETDPTAESVVEIARVYGASGDDMFTLAMWADACHRRADARHRAHPESEPNRMVLLMPYLPGARADHAEFVPLGAQVYADFINALGADQVVCFDPHSPVMPEMIAGVTVIDSTRLIRSHIVGRADRDTRPQHYDGIIAPDKGAAVRARQVANACHLPLYQAGKTRNPDTGKLSGFTCEPLPDNGRFLVVDDICDGGGTFMGLAEATGLPKERLGLYVSHGVFSRNAIQLHSAYGEIWTTDSFTPADRVNIDAHVIPLNATLNGAIA